MEFKNMYESLRLSAGGGLTSVCEKVSQNHNAATLVIGLGGTGKDAVRMVKKTIYERVRQDNYEARDTEPPRYDRIKFLVVDTDRNYIASPIQKLNLSEEYFHIGVADVRSDVTDKASFNNKTYLDWFNKEFNMQGPNQFYGGIRQIGRYLLSKRAMNLYNKFKDMIITSVTGLPGGFELNVYITTGIGGGTGSGCFIDVCYIMQQALADLGYLGSANVVGFVFLPDVNLSNPNFPKGGPGEILLKKNGYATLKELDYVMNIPGNGDAFKQEYSEKFAIQSEMPPVKVCYLLSDTDIEGTIIQDGYNYVMNVVADYVLNFVVEIGRGDKSGEGRYYGLSYFLCNTYHDISYIERKYGANYGYHLPGTSRAAIPYKKIGNYLAIKVFESIKYIQNYRPTRAEVDGFCQNIGFTFQNLDEQVKQGTRGLAIDADGFDIDTLRTAPVGSVSVPLAEYCERWKYEYEEAVKRNIATLGEAFDAFEVSDNPESVIGKIFKELISIASKPELGLYYAAYMINDAHNYSLTSVLAAIRKEIESRIIYAMGLVAYREKCEADAQAEFYLARFFEERKKREYVSMVERRYKNMVAINTYTAFLELIDRIKKHLKKWKKNTSRN